MTEIELNNYMMKKDLSGQRKEREERAKRRADSSFVAGGGLNSTSLEESRKSSAAIGVDELTESMSAANLDDTSQPKSAINITHQTPLKGKLRSASGESENSDSSTEVHGKIEGNPSHKSVVSPSSGRFATTIERGRTAIGPQVEHATARVVYSRMVDQIIDRTTISKTRDALREAFSHLPISSDDLVEMGNVVETAAEKIARYKAERDKIKELRGRTDLSFNPDVVNEVMVEGIKAMNAKTAAILIDYAVFAANKMLYANFPTEGVPANPNTGSEQTAKNRLALLSDVLERVGEIRDLSERTDDGSQEKLQRKQKLFREYFSPKKQDNLEKHWGITKDQVDGLLTGTVEIDALFTQAVEDKITNYVGQLFYYPRLQAPQHYTINGVEGDWAVTKEDWCDVMKIDPETEQRISGTPKYNSGTLPRSNDPEIMYDVAGRHLVAAFNAFRGLSRFGRENQEAMVDGFLEKSVLENSELNRNQGWEGLVDPKIGRAIDLDSTKGEIEKVTILGHKNRIFAAKNSPVMIRQTEIAANQEISGKSHG